MRIATCKGWLEPLSLTHSLALFKLIEGSHEHLHQWLPWPGRVHSLKDTEALVLELIAERGPQFVVRVEQHICGGIGFHTLDNTRGVASLGYWLGREFVGQGIMHDAVLHLCRHGFSRLGLAKIEIRCAVNNTPSRRVAETLGFYLEGKHFNAEWLAGGYVDHAVYSLLKQELPLN